MGEQHGGRSADRLNPAVRQAVLAVRRALSTLYGSRLGGVWVYGSYARGDSTDLSDLDILVVLDEVSDVGVEIGRMSYIGSSLSLSYDLTISFLPVGRRDFSERQSPFLINVRREGVPV